MPDKMDGRLSELKEKQAEIGNKISLLQATNKRKDEEAAEIRQLIAECRENLKRIKGIESGPETTVPNCSELSDNEWANKNPQTKDESSLGKRATKISESEATTKNPCANISNEKEVKCKDQNKKKRRDKERVSCKVDLNKMKVRIRGPSEDLKKLDATQLICLLEKYQCQELIINTGDEIIQDPGEIKMIYWLHPGNVVMVAGMIMIAFLVNANIFNENYNFKAKSFLNILYVGTFAFHYGMVLWMSFIRGYALKYGLNPDMFNLVDNMVLPKYFSVCVLLSALSLYSFLALHSARPCTSWPIEVFAQMIVSVVTFVLELTTICYIIPALIKLRDATDEYIIDDDEQECPPPESYKKNLVKLGKLNWTVVHLIFSYFTGSIIQLILMNLREQIQGRKICRRKMQRSCKFC